MSLQNYYLGLRRADFVAANGFVTDTGEGHRAAALSSLPREPPPLTRFHRPGLNSNATPPHGGFWLTTFFVMVCTKAQASDVEIC